MEDPNRLFWGVGWKPPLPNTPEFKNDPVPTMDSRLEQRLADSAKIWVAVGRGGEDAHEQPVIATPFGGRLLATSAPAGDYALWAHEWIAYRESYARWERAREPKPARLPRPTCPEVTRVSILEKDLAWKMREFLRRVIDVPLQAATDVLGMPTEAITKMLLSEPRPVYVPKPPPKVSKAGPGVFNWDGIRASVRKQLAIETIIRWKNKELNVGLTSYEEKEMDGFVKRLDNPTEAAVEDGVVGGPAPSWWLDFDDFWDEDVAPGKRQSPRGPAWRGMLGAIAVKYYSEQAQSRALRARLKSEAQREEEEELASRYAG